MPLNATGEGNGHDKQSTTNKELSFLLRLQISLSFCTKQSNSYKKKKYIWFQRTDQLQHV